ncbi:transposase [Calothrix sp. FACHB-1219]|uniref:transposase n=1 Tax=unclassified Calothrix TaxID=2619626 RepID=UPI001686F333|nr:MULTISPECIES: transposase [unclassified Calothrix]MBD2201969.1 transposase [Calothrix sp. FACHB-168]MBD2217005.1 transposase [Calothrix sp. FACHB-1219]
MAYNPKKHHRRSIRLPKYDYTQIGAYFTTICTYKKQCWFGDVMNGEMQHNQLGIIVYTFWQALPRRFSHIELDAFVVMPNHVHGILIITDAGARQPTAEQFGKPVPGSIPTIIRAFKSAVTKRINLMRKTPYPPIWQRNYYESIIRQDGLDNVRQYILNNPFAWAEDEENPLHHPQEQLDLDVYF